MVGTNEWGGGSWGTGVWGTQLSLTSTLETTVIENWPFDQVRPSTNDAIRDQIRVFGLALDRLDERISAAQQQTTIDTATDASLERLAREVSVTRERAESDERLRFRTTIRKAITRSDGTVSGLATVLAVVFGRQTTSRMSLSTPSSEPVVQLTIPSDVIADAPLTQTELQDELDDAIPATDKLRIITDDTFIFGETGSQGLSNGGLIEGS